MPQMEAFELKPGLYFTGAIDHDLRVFDIIMYTEYGTTYNSYVLKTQHHTVLFETAKAKCLESWLKKVGEITPIEEVDYLVVSHTEPDHSGSIERLLELNPRLKIVGTGCALQFLREIVNRDFYSIPIKDGQSLTVDDKTLEFIVVPNLHWPDTMYTYIPQDRVLVTCDSFGSHYAMDGVLLSSVMNTKLVCIFCKSFTFYAIFIGVVIAIITKIVVGVRILGNSFILLTICILGTDGSMQMQVFETMNLVVYLKVS